MNQHAGKWTRGSPHQQLKRWKFLQSKWPLLNEKGFLFDASKSVFQACADFTSIQRFL